MDRDWAFRFLTDKAESWLSSVNENADTSIGEELRQHDAIAIRKMTSEINHILGAETPISAEDVLDTAAQNLFGCRYEELRNGEYEEW